MYNPIELPSLQEIEQIEKQRQKATESLDIINDKEVKCQKCGSLQPLRPALTNSQHSGRIYHLFAVIKQIERYHIPKANANKEKAELKELLEQEDKKNILRRLPLYSSSITGYRFVCSQCYDELYYNSICIKNKNKEKKESSRI